MKDKILIDPRELYHNEKFPDQEQDTPALQEKMSPKPDCVGKNLQRLQPS